MGRKKASPDVWGSYEARRRRGAQGWWYVVGLLALAAVLVVAVGPGRVAAWFGAEDTSALPAETARPENAPATPLAKGPTGAHPFRGSPAARWADGRDGITVPGARATGWMSKAQVADALADTVDFLAASNLDPAVLRGERPREAIALINPHQKDMREFLKTAFSAPTREQNPLHLFSRFDTTLVQPATKVIKTRGRLDYRAAKNGAVQVTSDVTFVYALERAGGGEVTRTIVRRELVVNWDDPSRIITEPGTFSLVSFKSVSANGGCDKAKPVYAPTFDSDRATGKDVEATGPEKDPYDRSEDVGTLSDSDECGAVSRL
ncbi:hypothetical protein ACIP5N_02920 [Streptomyces sp. NPDC088768]|uniref:hypothetical protein n=1 Tax=Streptomyces sp. NPDC088768 TaxID=3365894 RepID=UPI0038212B8A